jgi:chromosome segregation ATPase
MKALLALLFGITITAISIYLHVGKSIDRKAMSIMFALAIIGGLAIANYDVLKRWKGLGIEMETAREQITEVKSDAINEIKKEVGVHKEAISVLMRSANELSDKIEKQKALAEALVKKAEGLEVEIEKGQTQLSGIKTDVLAANKATQYAKSATEELAKILTRIAFFQITTKNQFGTEQAHKAIQKITDDLNRLVNMMIPDPKERDAFVKNVMSELK